MKKWGFFLPALMSVVMVGCSTTPEQPTNKSEISKAETTQPEEAATTQPAEKPESGLSPMEKHPNVKPKPMPTVKPQQPKAPETTQPEEAATTQPAEKPESGLSPMEKHPNVKPKPMPTVKPQQPKAPETVSAGEKSADGKLILGQKEWVHIDGLDVNVVARIDTGATTSSVSAIDIVAFERDGKKWVKFKLAHEDKKSKELELPVVSTKSIRQSSSDETFERYVVEGWIKVGDLKVKTPFTLADRTHMDFGLLLGRSFFRDVAIVDVSREFVQPKVSLDASN